jgi:hypothetical protein
MCRLPLPVCATAEDQSPDSFFFIEGCVYSDTRHGSGHAAGAEVVEWAASYGPMCVRAPFSRACGGRGRAVGRRRCTRVGNGAR